MNATANTPATATQSDINFIKSVARDYGYSITDAEAVKCFNVVSANYAEQDFYQGTKEYFYS